MALLSGLLQRSNKGIKALANFTGIKSSKIHEMFAEVLAADPERGKQFRLELNGWSHDEEVLRSAATTFFIYRTFLRNRHPHEFRWWYEELRKQNAIPKKITLRELERASITLRHIGLSFEEVPEAQRFYNNMLAEM